MGSTPLPAKLVLLGELLKLEEGTKVRFLGCVAAPYSITTGRLILQHGALSVGLERKSSQISDDANHVNIAAHVDLDIIGSEITRGDISVGTWLNVIGYVEQKLVPQHKASSHTSSAESPALTVCVKALVVWPAGSVDVGAYEKVVRARQDSGKLMESGV